MARKKLVLSILSLISVLGLGLSSCNNVETIPGEQGPIGPEGPQGEKGDDGEDGSLIHTGEGKPEDSLGKDTDIYIDSKTGDLYTKVDGSWTLTMNIKGEDGKDGQDGSSGSDGKTAWSNTILPCEGGYITASSGSSFVGDDITFTFVPTSEDVSAVNRNVINNGTNVVDLEKDDNPLTFETTMLEGGFVVRVESLATKTEVNDAEGFREALENLKPGENVIELSDNVDLTNLDSSTETQVLKRLNENDLISTFSNDMENDWYLKTNVEIYVIDLTKVNSNKEKGVHLTIKSKGNSANINNKTLTVPFIVVLGNGNDSVSFKNVDMTMVYKINEIYDGKPEEMFDVHFFNGKGIKSLKFNNCSVSIEVPETEENLSPVNFINFDGTDLIFNNFEKTEKSNEYMETFIRRDGNSNPNLEKVYVNNSKIYGRQFISYYPHNSSKLDIEVNNSEFHALYNQSIISLRIDTLGTDQRFTMNCSIHNFDYYCIPELIGGFNVFTSFSNQTSAEAFETGNQYTHEYVKEQIDLMRTAPNNYRPQEHFNLDLSGVNLDISNLKVNGNRLTSIKHHETLVSDDMIPEKMDCLKGGDTYECFFDVYLDDYNPDIEFSFFNNLISFNEDCQKYNEDTMYYPHTVYYKTVNDSNLYPSLTLNNEVIDKNAYFIEA